MKNLKLNFIALQILQILIAIFVVSFLMEVVYLVIKGNQFKPVFNTWLSKETTPIKLIVYLLVSIGFAVYRLYKKEKMDNRENPDSYKH